MAADERAKTYQDLHLEQLTRTRAANRAAAQRILGILFKYQAPRSVLDVGCGLGTWLSVARELGASDIYGVDGPWLDDALLEIEPALVRRCDLEQEISLGRRFDLVICLEVAEHLSAAAADAHVDSLTRHADTVLFSAAIPFQGGHHHVNEQFPDYWAKKFSARGYRALDLVRPSIWSDRTVFGWLRQNMLLYVHERALQGNARLRAEASVPRILSAVLPDLYLFYMKAARRTASEHQALVKALGDGGTFTVTKGADGSYKVVKTGG